MTETSQLQAHDTLDGEKWMGRRLAQNDSGVGRVTLDLLSIARGQLVRV
jgi:hypothetical protein